MFFPGIPNIFVPRDSVCMLLKCMCNNISTEKKNWQELKGNGQIDKTFKRWYNASHQ